MPKRAIPTPTKNPGRPAGAPNIAYDVVEAEPTRCLKCKSTKRSPYLGKHRVFKQEFSDKTVTTTWKRTRCLSCNQHRMDKFVVDEPAKVQQ